MHNNYQKSVAVGFSGGVDSSVAAYLLKQQGFRVVAVTLNLTKNIPACNDLTQKTNQDAAQAAQQLGIEHMIDHSFSHEFDSIVVDSFISQYLNGATPNPCIVCNPNVKFKALFAAAKKMGCGYIATGHYAICAHDSDGAHLKRAQSKQRDQSYMLYRLNKEMLNQILFPLGEYDKPQIREIASEIGLRVAQKRDSQENCFIPNNDYAAFITNSLSKPIAPGNFIDDDGKVLGPHKGIIYYTIGQRKGLGAFGKRIFVSQINPQDNTVTLSDESKLFSTTLYANHLHWIEIIPCQPFSCLAKIRYGANPSPCMVYPQDDGAVQVVFETPQRAITKGQSVVFYSSEEIVLGGGFIL